MIVRRVALREGKQRRETAAAAAWRQLLLFRLHGLSHQARQTKRREQEVGVGSLQSRGIGIEEDGEVCVCRLFGCVRFLINCRACELGDSSVCICEMSGECLGVSECNGLQKAAVYCRQNNFAASPFPTPIGCRGSFLCD
jgi:hypothetical protein